MEVEEILALIAGCSAIMMFAGLLYQRSKDKQAEQNRKHQEDLARVQEAAEIKAALEYAERERLRIEGIVKDHVSQSPELIRQVATFEAELKAQATQLAGLDQKFDRRMDSLKDDIERIVNGRNH